MRKCEVLRVIFVFFLRIKADLSQKRVYLNAELQTQALQHSHTQLNLHLQASGLCIGGDKSRLSFY